MDLDALTKEEKKLDLDPQWRFNINKSFPKFPFDILILIHIPIFMFVVKLDAPVGEPKVSCFGEASRITFFISFMGSIIIIR